MAGPGGSPKRKSQQSLAVEKYVMSLGGCKPINSILISSNGIAAVKFIRSVRAWAYKTFGDERAIAFVAMATPEDLKVNTCVRESGRGRLSGRQSEAVDKYIRRTSLLTILVHLVRVRVVTSASAHRSMRSI